MELYAIKYGESLYNTKYIYLNDKNNKYVNFTWLFYLIKYKDKIILIDTGFNDDKLIKEYKIKYIDPLSILKEMGINKNEITDIIITHGHFDHIGNADKFPDANIYIQKDELKHFLKNAFLTEIRDFLLNNKHIITFDEEYNLFDFIKIKNIGGHTIGSSVIYIKYNNFEYLIAGDECYLLDNYINKKPVGTCYNSDNNINFIKSIHKKKYIVLTFHDPSIVNVNQKYTKIF